MINDVVGRRCTTNGRMAQLVEHIVHIDGVTGSSPVATTTRLAGRNVCQVFSYPTAMLERM